jgi:hypothetical protein
MRTGETVVRIAREGLPKNVMMLLLDELLEAPLFKKGLTPEQIKAVMKPVFASNLHLSEVKKLPSSVLERFEKIKDLKIQNVEVSETTMNSESTEPDSSGSGRQVDSTLEHFIRTIVNTHEFANMFFERLRKAARGNIKPLINLILGLVKKFNPNEVDLWELARKTLEIAREELKAPVDDELWNQILDSVRVELVT